VLSNYLFVTRTAAWVHFRVIRPSLKRSADTVAAIPARSIAYHLVNMVARVWPALAPCQQEVVHVGGALLNSGAFGHIESIEERR
jgi:hypothetical protein